MLNFYKMLQTWYNQSEEVERRIRNTHQDRTTNERSRPRKSSLWDEAFSALVEHSDRGEAKEAILAPEETLVRLHRTLVIRMKFTSKTVA